MFRHLLLLYFLILTLQPIPGRVVHDFAGIIPDADEQLLESLIQETRNATTADVAVVTVSSLQGLLVEEYANQLFNSWGLGDRDRNNGVLFLIAPNDRKTRIEVGRGLESLLTDQIAGEIIDSEIIPYFKQGDFSGGIREGTRVITELLERYPEAARGNIGSTPTYVITRHDTARAVAFAFLGIGIALTILPFYLLRKKKSYPFLILFIILLSFLILAASAFYLGKPYVNGQDATICFTLVGGAITAVLALYHNVRKFLRLRPHYCKKCGTKLTLLNEAIEDAHLTPPEQLEESLGSVDYDIWVCSACLNTEKKEYISYLSGFSACPQCGVRACSEKSTTVTSATTHSTGLARIDGECKSCWHQTTRTTIIPRISGSSDSSDGGSSSSSSSGSGSSGGGGGSSGGGGASGSW